MNLEERIEILSRGLTVALDSANNIDIRSARKEIFSNLSEREELVAFLKSYLGSLTEIPELLQHDDIHGTIGQGVYRQMGTGQQDVRTLLTIVFPQYGKINKQKCNTLAEEKDPGKRQTMGNAFFMGEDAAENATFAVKNAWENVWSLKHKIPELVTAEDIQTTVGSGIYAPLGIRTGNPIKVLRKIIPGYGKMNSEKFGVVKEKGLYKFQILRRALFDGTDAIANATFTVRFAWENYWKLQHEIPELVSAKDIKDTIGTGLYRVLGVSKAGELLNATVESYGVIDDDKSKVFVESKARKTRNTLGKAFFTAENGRTNATKVIGYAWENIWREKFSLPELVNNYDIQAAVGVSVYSQFDFGMNNPVRLLRETIPGFGALDEEKAETLISNYSKLDVNSKRKLKVALFQGADAEENIKTYLEVYQRVNNKRLVDLSPQDLKNMPASVRVQARREPKPLLPVVKKEVGYNQIQVHWTESMEDKLAQMYEEHGQGAFTDVQMIWETLGVTRYAALLKAGRLGLIQERDFSDRPTERFIVYPFIGQDITPDEMLLQAADIENRKILDAESYVPTHAQGLHVQLPVIYRGVNLDSYAEPEQEVLRTVSTYLRQPGSFTKVTDVQGLPCYVAPEETLDSHCIVAVRTGDDTPNLVKLYLPNSYSEDPGAIFTSVLQGPTKQVFNFRQKNPRVM